MHLKGDHHFNAPVELKLTGNPNYEPTVKGMQAALPFIDIFAPAHNVDSLRAVARML
jgi:uncharacterized protein with von Willebrand factor type A (vWA) domain